MKSIDFLRTRVMLTLSILFLSISGVLANPISPEKAKSNVQAFLNTGEMKLSNRGPLTLSLAYTINKAEETNYSADGFLYVFNISGENGFVIASGDDMAEPILGYCEDEAFDPNDIPENMAAWLDSYAKEIDWLQVNGYPTEIEDGPFMAATARKNISPMLTTKWGQGSPYNTKCKFNKVQCVTGCVATATAQLMYYWARSSKSGKYKGGSVALDGYKTYTKKYTVGALPALSTFNWSKMKQKSGKPDGSASKNAVAQLMRYCGQAVEMDYTKKSSGAFLEDAAYALEYYFGFDCGLRMAYADDMTASEFNSLIYNELAAKRPVLMAGTGKKGGHAFVCDGYNKKSKKFHFNWGWNGQYQKSYYALTALNVAGYKFNSHKCAVVGVNPMMNRLVNPSELAEDENEEMNPNDENMTKAMGLTETTEDGTEATGIGNVPEQSEADANAPYYNLQGVKVDNPTPGLYIRNGKKVLVR